MPNEKPNRRAAGNLRPARPNKVRSYVKADQPETKSYTPEDAIVAVAKESPKPSEG